MVVLLSIKDFKIQIKCDKIVYSKVSDNFTVEQ